MTTSTSSLLSVSIFKLFLFLPLLCQRINLVIGGDIEDDDSLENALEAIERRQRDLRLRENYGQPEDIGYGFQKNLGMFEPGPSRFLGATREADDYGLAGLFGDGSGGAEKRVRSSFRERNNVVEAPRGEDYLQAVRALWDRYQHQQHQRPIDLEELSDEELMELLGALQNDDEGMNKLAVLPRNHRSYRVFDTYDKRAPSFGQGLGPYGKRQQHLSRDPAQNDGFLYSLKWVNPAMNREGVEGLRAADPYAEDRDGDITAILGQPRYPEAETWLSEPATLGDVDYGNEQRAVRRAHRMHERKRAPVKRNANAAPKPTVSEEVEGIFARDSKDKKSTQNVPKKTSTQAAKKPSAVKADKSEKKVVVRRAEPAQPGEIQELFRVQKKSIDWSKHFGVNKRMYANPFDTRVFNTKRNLADNLDVVENRIGGVEDKILEDAVKLTGAHRDEGLSSIREGVLRRLEAAYSLEKMRSALETFKNSVNAAVTENPDSTSADKNPSSVTELAIESDTDKLKRVAIKKEGVDNGEPLDFFNWERQSEAKDGPECPLLEVLVNNCVRMEEALGKFADLLTPACTLHQICYTCGPEFGFSRAAACDLMFLSEAEHLCQEKPECVGGARETVTALREMHEQTPPLGTCRANPCVADHFLTSPSGIVTLDV